MSDGNLFFCRIFDDVENNGITFLLFVATRLISFCLSYAKQLLHGKGVGTDGKQNITEKGHKQHILNLNKWRLVGLNGTYTYPNNDQVCLW